MTARPLAAPALRHLLSRFSYGVTPALVEQAQSLGGADAWFDRQLNPRGVSDTWAAGMRDWFPYLDKSPRELYRAEVDGVYPAWQSTMDLGRWTILRRAYSRRQLQETMVEFWSNLLHVPLYEDESWPHRASYDQVIRAHALGRFEDMLRAATTHGAMGCYLDNVYNTRWAVNENLGRELLELHTVGVEAGYTEQEVLHSAWILTGYRVRMWESWETYYDAEAHKTGPVSVLGFTDPNTERDGRPLTRRYLRFLAAHPSTARRIARKLCTRFVSDTPSESIVAAVAAAYTGSGTDIKQTLRAMVAHEDFAASAGQKVRTPAEDAIASYRLLGARPRRPENDSDFARAIGWQLESLGQKPFGWPQPDGFPDVGVAWASVGRVLAGLDLHRTLAGGWWPSRGVDYPSLADRLPPLPATFADIVDHASRRLLNRKATPELQRACRQVLQLSARDRFAKPDEFGEWRMVDLLATVLNSPAHAAR